MGGLRQSLHARCEEAAPCLPNPRLKTECVAHNALDIGYLQKRFGRLVWAWRLSLWLFEDVRSLAACAHNLLVW